MAEPEIDAVDGLQRVRPGVVWSNLLSHASSCGRCRTLGPHGAHVARTLTGRTDPADPRVAAAFRRFAASTTTYRLALHRDGVPSPDPWRASPEHAAGLPVPEVARDPRRDLTHLIAHAERLRIVLNWGATAPSSRGFVGNLPTTEVRRRDPTTAPPGIDARTLVALGHGEVALFLNSEHPTPEATAETLLHELAHVLLGHLLPYLKAPDRAEVPIRFTLPEAVGEIEAILASYVAARRRGYGRASPGAFAHWMRRAEADDALRLVDLMRVFEVAERLVSWCRAGPEGDAVRAESRPPAPRPPAGAPLPTSPVFQRFPGPPTDARPDPFTRRVPEMEPT